MLVPSGHSINPNYRVYVGSGLTPPFLGIGSRAPPMFLIISLFRAVPADVAKGVAVLPPDRLTADAVVLCLAFILPHIPVQSDHEIGISHSAPKSLDSP